MALQRIAIPGCFLPSVQIGQEVVLQMRILGEVLPEKKYQSQHGNSYDNTYPVIKTKITDDNSRYEKNSHRNTEQNQRYQPPVIVIVVILQLQKHVRRIVLI